MAKLEVKIRRYLKKHKKKVVLYVLLIWLIIFMINMYIKNRPEQIPPPTVTYEPHVPIMDTTQEVPEKYQEPIETIIDEYFRHCNNGEYEQAYNLITDECKENVYPTLDQFTGYVEHVFEGKKKIYNIQSYSIVGNKYIYNIRILDDILATGTTGGYYYYEEKFVMIEENGTIKLSIGEFIEKKNLNLVAEDENMVIEISSVSADYDTIEYEVKIRNKTDKYIVISDNMQSNEIILDLGDQTRRPNNMEYAYFFINPNSEKTQKLQFNKYYDDGTTPKKLTFRMIRVLNDYDWGVGTTQENLDSAVRLYGLELNLENK
ncbi:MAG: hypothetical protein IKD76_04490 [Clostridia bacterium]|nr:hypothetical protein [Clostridia bacterium]